MNKVRIIMEVGSNYDGDLAKAEAYVESAAQCGADAVKFQTLRKDKIVAPKIFSEGQWIENPVYQNFSSLELADDWHYSLRKKANACGIEFMSTPFYLEAVPLLEKVDVRSYKIASGDITFTPLLELVGRTGKEIMLSTGASSLTDIERALHILRKAGADNIVLLHCVSNYPPAWEEMNLKTITTLKEKFQCPVGISDHSPGDLVPLAAVALGATVIEKHVTFDRQTQGPDHPFAMTMEEFKEMIARIRLLEQALGSGEKVPTATEVAKQHRLRRGVYDPETREARTDEQGLWLRPRHSLTGKQ